jgi:hypothetical protein
VAEAPCVARGEAGAGAGRGGEAELVVIPPFERRARGVLPEQSGGTPEDGAFGERRSRDLSSERFSAPDATLIEDVAQVGPRARR